MLKQDYHFESRALYPELKGKRVVVLHFQLYGALPHAWYYHAARY